jgi:hypothetical protein
MWLGQGVSCLEILKEGFTEKDRLKSLEELVHLFADASSRIRILSQAIIHCIQTVHLGTLLRRNSHQIN